MDYFNAANKENICRSVKSLKYRIDILFNNIDFNNKTVLDIGGGNGLYSFYASSQGASKVVCLEPEIEGSSSDMIDSFKKFKDKYDFYNANIYPIKFQDYNPKGEKFDIILLNNSINHLDEEACINLLRNEEYIYVYRKIFNKLYTLSKENAKIIISDCSNYNFFNMIKIKNFFSPTIEWDKHQSPSVWIKLLNDEGFILEDLSWSSPSSLGAIGKLLFGNKLMSFFYTSHFTIRMVKVK